MISPSDQFFVKISKIHIFSRLEFDLIEIILTKDYPKSNSTQLPVSSSQFRWNNLYCLTDKHFLSVDPPKMFAAFDRINISIWGLEDDLKQLKILYGSLSFCRTGPMALISSSSQPGTPSYPGSQWWFEIKSYFWFGN